MQIKCGKEWFDLNNKDIIMDNGSCYMIVTRKTTKGYWPTIPKATAKGLIKNGRLLFLERKKMYIEVDLYRVNEC